jgi:hypothetical protein
MLVRMRTIFRGKQRILKRNNESWVHRGSTRQEYSVEYRNEGAISLTIYQIYV